MKDHNLESLSISTAFIQLFWLFPLELHLSKCCQLESSSQILLKSNSPEGTIAFLFYKPRLFFSFNIRTWKNALVSTLFKAEHFAIWE